MKNIKLISLLSGLTLLATGLFGGVASAASGSLSLSSVSPQTNGTFAVTISEASDTTINYAEAHLTFSDAVQNVHFTTGGSFTQQSCGANCVAGYVPAGGTVSGTNTLATVYFTIPNPGSVTVGFAGGSYLAHPNPPSFAEQINVTGTAKAYTYNAPVVSTPAPTTGGKGADTPVSTVAPKTSTSTTKTATTTTSTTATVDESKAQVEGDSTTAATDTKKKDTKSDNKDSKKDDAKKTSSKSGFWFALLAILAIAAGFILGRRAVAAKAAAKARAAEKAAAVAAAAKAAEKKTAKASNKKNTKKAQK